MEKQTHYPGTVKEMDGVVELTADGIEGVSGGMLLLGFAIGMVIDHYLIKPLWY